MFSKNQSGSSLNRQLFETYMALDNWHQFRLRLFIEGIFRRHRRRTLDQSLPISPE